VVGQGPVRTGVTAILPRGRAGAARPVHAGAFSLNGNGELTGLLWLAESGQCEGPITLTSTHSRGAGSVSDAMVANETMIGRDGISAQALPAERLREILAAHGRSG